MKTLVAGICIFSLSAAAATASKTPAGTSQPASAIRSADARSVQYTDQEVIRIKTKMRYMTLIILPKDEQILDFTCGDKDWWVINGTQNFAYVKPAKAGAETNLNLVTASGN